MIVAVNEQNLRDAGHIHSEAWKQSHRSFCSVAFIEKHTAAAQTDYLRDQIKQGKRVFLLIEDTPIGVVSVHEGLIENLYVLPFQQNRGYGTQLLLFAIGQCSQTPTLWLLSNNERAYRLYAKHGFVKTGQVHRLNDTLYEFELQRSALPPFK